MKPSSDLIKMTAIHEHLRLMTSSLCRDDFKNSVFAIRRFVEDQLEDNNGSCPSSIADDTSEVVEASDDDVIQGLRELSTSGLEAWGKLNVTIYHLFYAVEKLEVERLGCFVQLGPTGDSGLSQSDIGFDLSKRLEDYIRSRRRTEEDIEKLLSSPRIKPCTETSLTCGMASDDLDEWVRHKVAHFLEKGLSVGHGPQYFRLMICFADCFDRTVYEEGLYLSCTAIQQSISRTSGVYPSHLFAQFGASRGELLHETTAYLQTLMHVAFSEVAGANEPARETISAVIVETLLGEALASIMGRSLMPSFTPTTIEWKIVQVLGDPQRKALFREATKRYWDSRSGLASTDTSDRILMHRFRDCFDRLFPRRSVGP